LCLLLLFLFQLAEIELTCSASRWNVNPKNQSEVTLRRGSLGFRFWRRSYLRLFTLKLKMQRFLPRRNPLLQQQASWIIYGTCCGVEQKQITRLNYCNKSITQLLCIIHRRKEGRTQAKGAEIKTFILAKKSGPLGCAKICIQ